MALTSRENGLLRKDTVAASWFLGSICVCVCRSRLFSYILKLLTKYGRRTGSSGCGCHMMPLSLPAVSVATEYFSETRIAHAPQRVTCIRNKFPSTRYQFFIIKSSGRQCAWYRSRNRGSPNFYIPIMQYPCTQNGASCFCNWLFRFYMYRERVIFVLTCVSATVARNECLWHVSFVDWRFCGWAWYMENSVNCVVD
jgi:hypothetical protein